MGPHSAASQGSLWDLTELLPPGEAPASSGDGWLTGVADLMDVLASAPTFRTVLAGAVVAASMEQASAQRSWRELVEDELVAGFADDTVEDVLCDEVMALIAGRVFAGVPAVTGVRVVPGGGSRESVDLWVRWQHEDGVTAIPVNVKVSAIEKTATSDLAVSMRALLGFLTDPEYVFGGTYLQASTNQMALELAAGIRELQHGRDYHLLLIDTVGGGLGSFKFQGMLASVGSDGRLAMRRHRSRDNALYGPAVRRIDADFDVVGGLLHELAVWAPAQLVRAALLTQVVGSAERSKVARALCEMSDAQVLAAALAGVVQNDSPGA